ncbi:MAG: hypothetical protein OYL92_15735 [Acidobacteriota bacterium]|nr:hypothetical protein [Acidobacteriota bacterium]MDE3266419.1 hypothetical protein [Acidobacteriota bacterium]
MVQLKYSAANPKKRWTAARLVQGRSRQNSVINKLAKAWRALDEQGAAALRVVLVGNQPVADELNATLGLMATCDAPATRPDSEAPPEVRLAYASGLKGDALRRFAEALSVSGGAGSRFVLEERALEAIGAWTDQNVQPVVAQLREFVRRRMLPEAAGELITRQSVLTHLGYSEARALFPCPSEIVSRKKLVGRTSVKVACERLLSGAQYLCLHGQGGIGKTAALEEIESALPEGSVMIKYDCYGAGRYLDPSALRHRPRDAFLQLTNELSAQMRLPLLLRPRVDSDYPRLFTSRLRLAASVLASQTPEALIVVAVDGADNAVLAAESRKPAEISFVRDYVHLTGQPANVRFVVTARTGRRATLDLPSSYESVEVEPFNLTETGLHVDLLCREPQGPGSLVEDFHHYSAGVPRTQRYAIKSGRAESLVAGVERLQPSGKSLDDLFGERFQDALTRSGSEASLQELCAGLVALARPVPLEALAAVLDSTVEGIRDLCADLAPGVRSQDGCVGFADEDLETFVRAKARDRLTDVRTRAADWMCARADVNPYAASNVAPCLHAAGRGRELLELVEKECSPRIIRDPTLCREVEIQRLRLAIRACHAAGDPARALRFVLMGADGAKTGGALRKLLADNPDLAVRFAAETAERLILFDPDFQESHGSLLMQKLAVDAGRSDAISVRAGRRALREWFRVRADRHEALAEENARPWRIQVSDVESTVEAAFKIDGPFDGLGTIRMWRPKQLALDVALSLPYRLIAEGRASGIEALVASGCLGPAASLFLLIPLALSGRRVDPELLARGLGQLGRRGLRIGDFLKGNRGRSSTHGGVLRTVMTTCEILTNRRWALELVDDTLARFLVPELRRIDKIRPSHTEWLDLLFRAYALREARAGRSPTVEGLFKPRPQEDGESERPSRRWDAESHDRSVRETAGAVSQVYGVVARALVNGTPAAELEAGLLDVQRGLEPDRRKLFLDHDGVRLRRVAAANVLVLLAAGYSPDVIKSAATGIRGGWRRARPDPGREFVARLSLWRTLHASLIEDFGAAASEAEDMRIAADEKVEILVKLARYTRSLSESDAQAIFSKAVDATGELDYEVVAQIRLLERLVRRGGDSFSDGRGTARRIGDVVEDAAIRLDGYYGDFPPWEEGMSALARLDAPLALASAARWDESGVGLLGRTLPATLKASTERGSLRPSQAAALSLMTRTDGGATASALQVADQTGSANLTALAEEAAYDHLVDRTYWGRAELVSCIERNQVEGRWSTELARREEQREPSARRLGRSVAPGASGQSEGPLEGHVWSRDTLVDSSALREAVEALSARSSQERPLPVSSILTSARRAVAASDRLAHVEALARFRASRSGAEPATSLLTALDEWHGSPAIASWCRQRLPDVIEARLPEFSRWVADDEQELRRALALTELPARQAGDLVLRGVERHVDRFKPDSILALAGLMSGSLSPSEAVALTDWYSIRLWQRVPTEYRRSQEALGDTPVGVDEAVARFLFTYMGDCDVRLRWRAAHAARRLARLGQESTLKALVSLYGRCEESTFRERESCFYWLAARLWFVVTWDRIAGEAAATARVAAAKLLQIALDESFPHILVRSFARDACRKLVAAGNLRLSSGQQRALENVNRSPLPRGPEATDVSRDLSFWAGDERFRFDSVDTLPYWYEPMLRSFSRVSGRQFLEEAERWILDVWYSGDAIDAFEARGSRGRFGRHDWQLSRNSHGAMPTLERVGTYLEWHAMWCAAGHLLKTEPLARSDHGSNTLYSLENRVEYQKLTEPPLWSADLLVPAPVRGGEREELPDLEEWLRDTSKAAASLTPLFPKDVSAYLIVDGFTERLLERRREHVSVRSALVSAPTARPLLRALQTMDDPWDYGMPYDEEGYRSEFEIEESPYRFLGWLERRSPDPLFDDKDPLREFASSIVCRPGPRVMARCGLSRDPAGRPRWSSDLPEEPMFIFEVWGTSERRLAGSFGGSRTAGHRLLVHREQLQRFLEVEELDAICEVEVSRRERTRQYTIGSERDAKGPCRAARVYRFASHGGLEIAEGGFGTWTGDCPAA